MSMDIEKSRYETLAIRFMANAFRYAVGAVCVLVFLAIVVRALLRIRSQQ